MMTYDGIVTPPLHIPTQLIAGICTDDQLPQILTEEEIEVSLISSLHATKTVNWEHVQTATSSDDTMQLLLSTIEDGIPEQKHQMPPTIREFHQYRKNLYTVDGVVIYKDRIVIPCTISTTFLSYLITRSSPRHLFNDLQSCNINLLARHHQ